jgi:hypothetical protein
MQVFHRKIVTLIKAGQPDKAYADLRVYLSSNPSDAEAWYLLFFVAPTQQEKIEALRTTLQQQPDHVKATQRLSKITLQNTGTNKTRYLTGTLTALTLLFIAAAVIFWMRQSVDTEAIPTLAVLSLSAATATSEVMEIVENTITPIATLDSVEATSSSLAQVANPTVAAERTPTGLSATTTPANAIPFEAMTISSPVATAIVLPSEQMPPTANPTTIRMETVIPTTTVTIVQPTRIEPTRVVPEESVTRQSPTQIHILPTMTSIPVATLSPDGTVPLGQPFQIGTGEMRVLSSTVPANELITTLGGTVPPTPPNQQWVVIEILIICNANTNCNPAISEFSLHTNGDVYRHIPLSIESALGDGIVVSGQVWGHLTFLIPTSEQPRVLQLQRGNTSFQFSVQ